MSRLDLLLLILKTSNAVAGDHGYAFSESEFAKHSGIPIEDINDLLKDGSFNLLNKTSLNEISCICGSKLKISPEINFAFCPSCKKKLDLSSRDRFNLTLNFKEIEKIVLGEIENIFISNDWKIKFFDTNRWLVIKDSFSIAISFSFGFNTLEKYFQLRGWQSVQPNSFIMIAENFSSDLVSYIDKDPKCNCINLSSFLDKKIYSDLLNKIKIKSQKFDEEKIVETQLNLHPQEHHDLLEIKKHFEQICNNILIYGNQKGTLHSSIQGREFQKQIAALFHLSLFRTKMLGSANEPDAMGYISQLDKKTIWCPFEIKSSKEEIFAVSHEALQVRKYCSALDHTIIRDKYDVRFIILVANNFEENAENDQRILKKLEVEFPKYRFIRFPLRSVIRMARLFITDPPLNPLPESIISFLNSTSYVTEEKISGLHSELKSYDDIDDRLFSVLKKSVSSHGTK